MNDRLCASLDPTDARQTPSTWAGLALVHSLSQVANPVPDQWHRVVVEVGDHDLADLARLRGAALDEHLDEVRLVHHVVVITGLTLVGDP